MKMSILIPTHNRPKLFTRCISSILDKLPNDFEVIVNNDSNDIAEIEHPQVSYHYNKFENLSLVYKFLLDNARGEYVYFLEDDDYVVDDFTSIPLDADIIAGNYFPLYGQRNTIPCMRLYSNALLDTDTFINQTDTFHLQLGQYIFKRSTIQDFEFPMDSNIHNDIKLVFHAAKNASKIKTMNKVFYYQTIDGGDNISFPHLAPNK